MTQYGEYKTIKVNQLGCYENDVKCSEKNLDTLCLREGNYISFKLGVRPDAAHVGGMNLFGEKFGDYAQGLVMNVKIDNNQAERETQ